MMANTNSFNHSGRTSPEDRSCRLADLQVGDKAVVVGYDRNHAQYLNRLLALGLTRGSQICVVRKAPLGDPVDVSVRGYNLTLRRDEAAVLFLEAIS